MQIDFETGMIMGLLSPLISIFAKRDFRKSLNGLKRLAESAEG